MLFAQVYVPVDQIDRATASLEACGPVRRIVRVGVTQDARFELVTAELDASSADAMINALERAGVAAADIAIQHVTPILPVEAGGGNRWFGAAQEDFVWMQLVGHARRNARLFARYIALMIVAGVIAAFGVIDRNGILIVGAMAVSPDLLPACAACVGIVGRNGTLIVRALGTLAIGIIFAAGSALLVTVLVRALGQIPEFTLGNGGLGLLTTVNYSTICIALAAGVAAILAFETNAGAAVGVAISVTTIPAAAYMGVAFAIGSGSPALGAVDVLLVNIGLLVLAGTLTLFVQRRLRSRQVAGRRTRDDGATTG